MEPSSFKSPGGYTLTKDGTTTSDDAEAAPVSGLAAQYWSLLSTVYNQGSMSSLLTSINPFARAITLAGVKTPVQQVVVSASAMRSDLNFGPPDHLQPQDLLTILQAVAKR